MKNSFLPGINSVSHSANARLWMTMKSSLWRGHLATGVMRQMSAHRLMTAPSLCVSDVYTQQPQSSLCLSSAVLATGCCQMSRLCSPGCCYLVSCHGNMIRIMISMIRTSLMLEAAHHMNNGQDTTAAEARTEAGHRSQLRLPVSSQTAAVTSCHSCRARLLLSQSELHFSSLTTIHRYTPLQLFSPWERDFNLKDVRNFWSGDTLGCVHVYKHSFSIILSNITFHVCINSQSRILQTSEVVRQTAGVVSGNAKKCFPGLWSLGRLYRLPVL